MKARFRPTFIVFSHNLPGKAGPGEVKTYPVCTSITGRYDIGDGMQILFDSPLTPQEEYELFGVLSKINTRLTSENEVLRAANLQANME